MPFKDLGAGIPIASALQTIGAKCEQPVDFKLKYLSSLEDAGPGAVCFTRKAPSSKVIQELGSKGPLLVLAPLDFEVGASTFPREIALARVADPFASLLKLVPLFYAPYPPSSGVSEKADINPSAKLGKDVRIGAFCAIGPLVEIADDVTIHPLVTVYAGVKIGAGSVIHSGAVIREDCVLGARSVVQNGAVIGADGFGFLPDGRGGIVTVPQIGTVRLGNEVEIGANACVDRATLGTTRIDDLSKVDNLVQIGHNVQIGRATIICGQAGLAGSAKIGNNVIIGGGAGVTNHASIADGCRVAALTGVHTDLKRSGDYAGYPAMPANLWRRQVGFLSRLAKEALKNRKRLSETRKKNG